MAQHHFVASYEKLVKDLTQQFPLDEAMSRAVGGLFELMGSIETGILLHAGLRDGMRLVDLGCGSGRLASVVGSHAKISYLGIDVVEDLVQYARTKSPCDYEFTVHRELTFPCENQSVDMVCAFSVFTHLYLTEVYAYIRDAARVLRPNGVLVFSFLELTQPAHWQIFQQTLAAERAGTLPHLNTFIERPAIEEFAKRAGYRLERFIGATEPVWQGHCLGQSTAILVLPGAESEAPQPAQAGAGAFPRGPSAR
jgi:2-polyprenyl-3-methyl-5-hydroxy-6-metoxy-1,4-benzoquinol methylase